MWEFNNIYRKVGNNMTQKIKIDRSAIQLDRKKGQVDFLDEVLKNILTTINKHNEGIANSKRFLEALHREYQIVKSIRKVIKNE